MKLQQMHRDMCSYMSRCTHEQGLLKEVMSILYQKKKEGSDNLFQAFYSVTSKAQNEVFESFRSIVLHWHCNCLSQARHDSQPYWFGPSSTALFVCFDLLLERMPLSANANRFELACKLKKQRAWPSVQNRPLLVYIFDISFFSGKVQSIRLRNRFIYLSCFCSPYVNITLNQINSLYITACNL